jgi:hypothetical protein
MSRESRRRRAENKGKGKRYARVTVVAHKPTLIGVGIGYGEEQPETVIPPDEARTLACKFERNEPELAKQLREAAASVDEVLNHPDISGLGAIPVSPKMTGPEALRDWVYRHREYFRNGYRVCPPGSVMWVMPLTESLDDPPQLVELLPSAVEDERGRITGPVRIEAAVHVMTRDEATEQLARVGMSDGTKDPPPPGCFYVVASRKEGRFKGTFVGYLTIPGPQDN